ncbi:MAG: hypothetical protein ACM3O7_03680 [Acidobacteriota bacterium]
MRARLRTLWISALALAVAGSVAAAGAKLQSKKFDLFESTSWNGKQLPAGEYKVVWHEDGTDLKVTLMNGHHVVAEGRGRIEERAEKARTDAVISRLNGSGAMALAELQMGGKKEVLVFAGS